MPLNRVSSTDDDEGKDKKLEHSNEHVVRESFSGDFADCPKPVNKKLKAAEQLPAILHQSSLFLEKMMMMMMMTYAPRMLHLMPLSFITVQAAHLHDPVGVGVGVGVGAGAGVAV